MSPGVTGQAILLGFATIFIDGELVLYFYFVLELLVMNKRFIQRILVAIGLFVCSMAAQTLKKIASIDLPGPKGGHLKQSGSECQSSLALQLSP